VGIGAKIVYLDYAAATPVDRKVLAAMQPFFSDQFYNPSALYGGARSAKAALEAARHSVGRSIGARPSEITFTAGGTESANLAVEGILQAHPNSNLVISAVEHEAVREAALKYDVQICKVDQKARVAIADLKQLITDKTVLVSVMYANNEVGTVQPIKDIVELVATIRMDRKSRGVKKPLYVHIDACQAPNYLDINIARLGVDLMTLNGGKIYGPKQSGVLYHRIGVDLNPQIVGGGQEYGLRSGTENVAFAVGFALALEQAVSKRNEAGKSMQKIARSFIEGLETRFSAHLNGHAKLRLPNNIHVTFPGIDNERALFSLDEQGIWAAAGSACSASNDDVSHVLTAMGVSAKDAQSSIRFSLGRHTTLEELGVVLDALEIALKA
jgi:cysteine desulfurase